MSFVAKLMDMAVADTDVLRSLDEQGDNFALFREVDFLLLAPSLEKAQTICGFINDHSYGRAEVHDSDGQAQVQVFVDTPVTQPIILCISGFMACIAQLFGAEYDGWGCTARRGAPN